MKDTERVLSPGILYTRSGRYRLIQSHPIHRDDYPYALYNTFLVTPEENIAKANGVHVSPHAITVTHFEVAWIWRWIDVALPQEDDEDYRLLMEDVVTDQDPVTAMPDYYPENDPDGYSCCGDEGV